MAPICGTAPNNTQKGMKTVNESCNFQSLAGVSVIIPSLDPDERLAGVVNALRAEGFDDIILVDDGSKPENKAFFPAGNDITLLVHQVNRGKGAALKTALNHVQANRPNTRGAVTCDGDGQHLASDVRKVCLAMLECGSYVLGVRDFSLPDVPKKSRVGNRASTFALALVCGVKISDTQTGLRAIPPSLLAPMANVRGERFEYETNVLLELKAMHASYAEVTIETVYLDSNKSSHFRPFADTLRIASLILKYVGSSLAAFAADILLFTLFNQLFAGKVILATILARLLSSAFNFTLNRSLVFHSDVSVPRAALKYYALAVPVMLISAFGVKGLAALLGVAPGNAAVTFIKMIVDFVLFLVNFRLQKFWIFCERGHKKRA